VVAIGAYERAAELSEVSARRGGRLVRAAEMAFELGRQESGVRLLRAAEPTDLAVVERTRLSWLRALHSGADWSGVPKAGSVVDFAERMTVDAGRSTSPRRSQTSDTAPFYGTTGVSGDLYAASQAAVRAMIDHLASTYGLSPEDAYVLCSLMVDLKISEIVDGGQYIVSALLPQAVFQPRSAPLAVAS
jgi:hypothetical protein